MHEPGGRPGVTSGSAAAEDCPMTAIPDGDSEACAALPKSSQAIPGGRPEPGDTKSWGLSGKPGVAPLHNYADRVDLGSVNSPVLTEHARRSRQGGCVQAPKSDPPEKAPAESLSAAFSCISLC